MRKPPTKPPERVLIWHPMLEAYVMAHFDPDNLEPFEVLPVEVEPYQIGEQHDDQPNLTPQR